MPQPTREEVQRLIRTLKAHDTLASEPPQVNIPLSEYNDIIATLTQLMPGDPKRVKLDEYAKYAKLVDAALTIAAEQVSGKGKCARCGKLITICRDQPKMCVIGALRNALYYDIVATHRARPEGME